MHYYYEKSCLWQLDSFGTKVPKKLIYNYATIVPWKYEKLINKMLGYKIKESYKNAS
jgi:hypothetical protein